MMLVIRRRKNERIKIGDNTYLTVLRTGTGAVYLGFQTTHGEPISIRREDPAESR